MRPLHPHPRSHPDREQADISPDRTITYPGAVSTIRGLRSRLARWIDPQTLPQPARQKPLPPERQARTGLVVAGGGARSSFEIGALHYLYASQRIDPVFLSGTSAGSILVAVLAQNSDSASQREALERLRKIWLEMTGSADMFTELPWFTTLRTHIPTWRKVMAMRQRQANRATLSSSLSELLSRPREAVARIAAPGVNSTHPAAQDAPDPDVGQGHGHTTQPSGPSAEESPQAKAEQTPPEHTRQWHPNHALETLTTLWDAGRSTNDLESIVRGAQQARSAFTPGPIVQRLLDPDVFQPERVSTSAVTLRIAVVSLESGELRYVDEQGRLRNRADEVIDGLDPVDLVDAVRASCAIPGVFPPVLLAGEYYVDGGVRENVPAAVALDRGDLDRCYVVVASPAGVPPSDSFAGKDLAAIIMRSATQINADEIQGDEVRYARERGAVIIQPELDIHDLVTIEPGLISIAMDYGYLRAADVCEAAGPERLARTRDVIQLRRLIWSTEDETFRPEDHASNTRPAGTDSHSEPEDSQIEEIGELKLRLRDLIAAPGSEHLPPEADSWWRDWERHPVPIDVTPHWPGSR